MTKEIMVIRKESKLFVVYQKYEALFSSTNLDDCSAYVEQNGMFEEERRKMQESKRLWSEYD